MPGGASISFGGVVNATTSGGQSLSMNAGTGGTVTLTGFVGNTLLSSFTISNAATIVSSAVFTTGAISYTAATINLAHNITATSGSVTFNGAVTINSPSLFVITGTTIVQNGTLTTNITTNYITTAPNNAIQLGGSITSSNGYLNFYGPIVLTGDVTINVSSRIYFFEANHGGNSNAATTIDGDSYGTRALTLNSTGDRMYLYAAVGSHTPLKSFTYHLTIPRHLDYTFNDSLGPLFL
jgi:hypothetical protein